MKKSPACHSTLVSLMADSQMVDASVTFSHMSEEYLLFFRMNFCQRIRHIIIIFSGLQLYCNPELSQSHNSVSGL